MANFQGVVMLLLAFVLVITQAVPQRKRFSSRLVARQRTRVLARQEIDAVTPYPAADELKPEIPFEEVLPEVPSELPRDVGPLPDEVYGPPDVTDNHIPDEIYGPPEFWLPADEPGLSFEEQARLVTARRIAKLRQRQAYRKAAYRQVVSGKRSLKLRVLSKKRFA